MANNLPANEGDAGSIPDWEGPLEKEMTTHSSVLAWEIPWTEERDSDSIPDWEDPLEKEMTIHSSVLACEIPWTEEPGGLQSVGLQQVGHDFMTEQTHHTDLVISGGQKPEMGVTWPKPRCWQSCAPSRGFWGESHAFSSC